MQKNKERQSEGKLPEHFNRDTRFQRALGIILVAAVVGGASVALSKEPVRDAISRFNPHCIEDFDPNFHMRCSVLNPESPVTPVTPSNPTFPRTIHEYYATSEALRTPHRVPLLPNTTPTAR